MRCGITETYTYVLPVKFKIIGAFYNCLNVWVSQAGPRGMDHKVMLNTWK